MAVALSMRTRVPGTPSVGAGGRMASRDEHHRCVAADQVKSTNQAAGFLASWLVDCAHRLAIGDGSVRVALNAR